MNSQHEKRISSGHRAVVGMFVITQYALRFSHKISGKKHWILHIKTHFCGEAFPLKSFQKRTCLLRYTQSSPRFSPTALFLSLALSLSGVWSLKLTVACDKTVDDAGEPLSGFSWDATLRWTLLLRKNYAPISAQRPTHRCQTYGQRGKRKKN